MDRPKVSAILALIMILAAVPTVAGEAKARDWRVGRLLSLKDESWTSRTTTLVTCNSTGGYTNCTGGQGAEWAHDTYYVTIAAGSKSYFASRTLSWRFQRSPRFTENMPVRFAVEGDKLFVLDETGREFKMYLSKKRKNTPAEHLEECRTTMQEIHESYAGLREINAWLSGLSEQDLLNTFIYNLDCSTQSITLQDLALLSQFEVIRTEMLLARAAKDSAVEAPGQNVSPEACEAYSSELETRPTKSMTPAEVSGAARRLYDCAMSGYQRDPKTWFLPTGKARSRLLTEVVARQSGAAIGEHGDGATPELHK